MKKINKLVATLLCSLMVLTSFNLSVFAENTDDELAIYNGSSIVSEIELPANEKVVLQTSYDEKSNYQWQIATDSNKTAWVNIFDQTNHSINISYPMVSGLLDSTSVTYLRVIKDGVTSQPIKVTVVEPSEQNSISVDVAESSYRMLKSTYRLNGASYSVDTPLASEGDYNTYNIIVNYVYEDGSPAYDSYAATIEENGAFKTKVSFPTVVGYLPYLNGEQVNELDIDIAAVTEDVTYTVIYSPTFVTYKVHHMLQNALDDNYVLNSTEEKQGLTNSIVADCQKVFDGYTALLYEKVAIAADGSTEVTVYYDRNYYLLNFDLDGGYGVEPIYARYETPINDVGTPTKAGYIFKGWTLSGIEASLPKTIPAENRTYKAVWETNSTAKVTIVFWGENPNDEEYSYIKSSEIYVKPATEFTYSEDGSLVCGLEVHTHDASCYELTCDKEVHTHSEACYTCEETEHTTHTTACYEGVGDEQKIYTDKPRNPSEGQVFDHWRYGKMIYINGKYYKYSGSTSPNNIAPTICHKHTSGCIGCGKVEHTHSFTEECYTLTCTKEVHAHTSDCYMSGAGLDSDLWTFVKSDTVIVEADGSSVVNVYYDRTEKTLTFKYNYSNRNYQSTETITAKWGSDISKQYKKIAANAGSTFWSAQTSGNGPYTNYFGVMPQTSATYYNRGTTADEGKMTYWGQDLNENYNVVLFEVTGVGGYYVTDEDRYEFEGFTYHHGTENGDDCGGAAFYYTRNSYKLTFNDGYNDVKTETVLYEDSLAKFSDYVPEVPSAYEPGSVAFGGWYLNPECTGNEYKLADKTMPAENVLLYAKWVPVTHTVRFFLDKITYDADITLSTHPDQKVSHNGYINGVKIPENGRYSFIGWFYMENGVEKAFDFSQMPITKDMDVYGKWSANVLVEYKIQYVFKDEKTGEITYIADETNGSVLAGTSKTFDAKTGNELYKGYQEGYYPLTGSHNITMDIDGNIIYQFEYVRRESVKYTVRYIDKSTGLEMSPPDNYETSNAVVTEKFKYFKGYMPDAYQKRLVLSADPNQNVIIFYYTADTENAYYVITHWVQNIEGDGYTEYRTIQSPGKIGSTITEEPLTISGFEYNELRSTASGEVTIEGLALNLYYDRKTYPLTVKYLEYGTNKELATPYTSTEKYRFGKQVSGTAISIKGYKLVGQETKTTSIKEGENEIIFYYTEEDVTIRYVAVEPGYGTVSIGSETVKAKTGTASGSTPTAKPRYRFIGWYTDEECTTPVNSSWVDSNNHIDPQKADEVYVSTTYYAKFVENLGDLTIKKNGCSDIDENQTFLFRLKGLDEGVNDHIDMVVTIHGNDSVTIKDLFVGNYSVTELTDWSFRYKPDAVTKNVNVTTTGLELTFNNNRSLLWWLDGSNYKVNLFKQGN